MTAPPARALPPAHFLITNQVECFTAKRKLSLTGPAFAVRRRRPSRALGTAASGRQGMLHPPAFVGPKPESLVSKKISA